MRTRIRSTLEPVQQRQRPRRAAGDVRAGTTAAHYAAQLFQLAARVEPHKTPERADLLQTMFEGMGRAVPVGQAYYDETLLPEKYRHNLLVARWCTRAITRYPIEPRGASFQAKEEVLLQGKTSLAPSASRLDAAAASSQPSRTWPTTRIRRPTRSELVMITTADDKAPFVGYESTDAKLDALWDALSDPSWHKRYRAHIELMRRGGESLKAANKRLLTTKATDPAVHHLIWLAARSQQGSLHLLPMVDHTDPLIRVQAIRALSEFPEHSPMNRSLPRP